MISIKIISAFIISLSLIANGTSLASAEGTSDPNAGVETKVREYFADIPIMITIAKCESNFRQYTAGDQTMKDATGTYIGLFQIDEQLHFMQSWGLGMNLYTAEGNMQYARHLYNRSGTNPWKGCLPKQTTTTSGSAPSPIVTPTLSTNPNSSMSGQLTRNLRMGMTNDEVKLLQQILNKSGFIISPSGPGSPGNETTMFGHLTREAVKKFQCAKNIVCDGNEGTTGYGRIGPATRAALNKTL